MPNPLDPKPPYALRSQGSLNGINFYRNPQGVMQTVYTSTRKLGDGRWANFPTIIPFGETALALPDDQAWQYWENKDPSKFEYFNSETEAIEAAKAKSRAHDKMWRER